jgi:hypothetical protein
MSRFSGRYGTSGPKAGRKNKGILSAMRVQKRLEAEERAENVLHDRTRKHRLGKCEHAGKGSRLEIATVEA